MIITEVKALIVTITILFALFLNNATALEIQITHSESYEELSRFTEKSIRTALPDLTDIVGTPQDTLFFFIASSRKEFRDYTGGGLPDWANGVTIFPANLVVLKSPDFARTSLRRYRVTVLHELVHLIQGQQVPLNLTPLWFNEGVAVYFTDNYNTHSKVLLSRAITNNSIIPLNKLSDVLSYSQPKAELAYAESASVIEYLVQVYGIESISQILENMKSRISFEKSLQMVTGIDNSDFHYYWRNYIKRAYNWVFLLDIQYIIWLIIPVMVVLAFLTIKRRNRLIKESWNDEIDEAEI